MKKLLYYAPFVNRGGVKRVVESVLGKLAQTAAEHDWEIQILGQGLDENQNPVKYPSIPFQQLEPNEKLPLPPKLYEALIRNSHRNLRHLAEMAPDYDLIYCPNPLWGMWGEWEIETPFVCTIHDYAWDFVDIGNFFRDYYTAVCYKIAERAEVVTGMSNYHLGHGAMKYGFKKTKLIPNSADLFAQPYTDGKPEIDRVREKYHLPEKYILLPHALHHHGIDIGLRGYDVARNFNQDIPPLVICGIGTENILDPKTDYERSIYMLIQWELRCELGRDILIVGTVDGDDMGALFAGAVMTLVPSRMDGDVSGSAFQAIQSHSPLVMSDFPAFTERLNSNRVLFFKMDDPIELADRILTVPYHGFSARMRADTAFLLEKFYTLDSIVERYWKLFKETVSQNPNRANEKEEKLS